MIKTINFSVNVELLECDDLTLDDITQSIEKTVGIYLAHIDKTVLANVELTSLSENLLEV